VELVQQPRRSAFRTPRRLRGETRVEVAGRDKSGAARLEPDRGSLTISGRGYLALQYDDSGRHVLLV
jgi:hypothetical protein